MKVLLPVAIEEPLLSGRKQNRRVLNENIQKMVCPPIYTTYKSP
jgi:hypothetical protein